MGGLFGDAGAVNGTVNSAALAGGDTLAGRSLGMGPGNQAPGAAVRRGSGPRGFTLLELLITLSVTTIGLIGLVSLHLSIARGNDGAGRSAEAQQLTATRLEWLRAQRLPDMMQTLTGSQTMALPTVKKTWVVPGRANTSYTVTAWVDPLPTASPGLMRLHVETTWTEDGGTPGANPALDHKLALEVIRTLEDSL